MLYSPSSAAAAADALAAGPGGLDRGEASPSSVVEAADSSIDAASKTADLGERLRVDTSGGRTLVCITISGSIATVAGFATADPPTAPATTAAAVFVYGHASRIAIDVNKHGGAELVLRAANVALLQADEEGEVTEEEGEAAMEEAAAAPLLFGDRGSSSHGSNAVMSPRVRHGRIMVESAVARFATCVRVRTGYRSTGAAAIPS